MARSSSAAFPAAHLVAVGVGGAVGTAARAALVQWDGGAGAWPWPTFIANVVGTAVLVMLMLRAPALMRAERPWRSLLGVGFCGGLTTFSLFQVELVRFLKDGRPLTALGYGAASLAAGLLVALAVPGRRA